MKNAILHIQVSKYFNNQVNSRSSIESLFHSIGDAKRIIIDFSNIDFISRSSAHELLAIIDKLSKNNYSISYLNLNQASQEMLDKVALSIKSNFKSATYVNRIEFQSQTDVDDYLIAI